MDPFINIICLSYSKQHVHPGENLCLCSGVKDCSASRDCVSPLFTLSVTSVIFPSQHWETAEERSGQFGTLNASCAYHSEPCPRCDCATKVLPQGSHTLCALSPSAPHFPAHRFSFALLEFRHIEIILFLSGPILIFSSSLGQDCSCCQNRLDSTSISSKSIWSLLFP